MLTGEINIFHGFALIAGDSSKLPRQIAGVRAFAQRIGRPMLQMHEKPALHIAFGGSQSAGKHLIQIAKKTRRFALRIAGIQIRAATSARISGEHASARARLRRIRFPGELVIRQIGERLAHAAKIDPRTTIEPNHHFAIGSVAE
jgi:hypothetical protein